MGLPKALLTDRGSPFTSALMKKVCQVVVIEQLFAVVQHPQTDELTERLNQTLKSMLAKAIQAHPKLWDLCVDLVLFTLRGSPQASTGFSPFALLYGRQPCGLLKVRGEGAEGPEEPKACAAEQYVAQLQDHL